MRIIFDKEADKNDGGFFYLRNAQTLVYSTTAKSEVGYFN
jgi:hypothetical protein